MHTETERPRFEFWPMTWLGEIGFLAVTMLRSLNWRNDTCWPALDRGQVWISVVNRIEFHALPFVHWSLLPEMIETKVKRNINKWHVRRVSFWNDCDEQI